MASQKGQRWRHMPHAYRRAGPGRSRLAGALAGLLLALAAIGCGVPLPLFSLGRAQAAPLAATATSTATIATATTPPATATPVPATLKLLSPSGGRGPAGANVTIAGANFSGGQVDIFAAMHSTCDGQQTTLGSVATNGGAFTAYTFIWPTALPPQQYYICGTGMSANAPGYWELTQTPPTLSLSTVTIAAGQAVTITGSSFYGAQSLDISVSHGSTVREIQSVVPGGDGSFSIQYIPDSSLTGPVLIVAKSPVENSAPPALQASATLTIQPATTATAGVTPSPQSTQPASGAVPPATVRQTGGGGGLLGVIIASASLLALIIIGLVVFFVFRGRGETTGTGYPGYAVEAGGRGTYASGPAGYAPRQTGRPSWQSGPSGAEAYREPPPIGAVARWEDDSRPGPDWQPRPMSGNRRSYDEPAAQPDNDDYPTNASSYLQGLAHNPDEYLPEAMPPVDPWAHEGGPEDIGGGDGATNPAGYMQDEAVEDDQPTQVQPRSTTDVAREHGHEGPEPGRTRPDRGAEDDA